MKRILSFSAVVLSASVCAQAAPTPANLGDGYPANALTVTRQAGSNGPVLYLTVRARKFEETGGGSSRLEGDVAMANAGQDTNGSQFFFVYKDSPLQAQYSLFGKVIKGLDIVKKVGEGGDDNAYAQQSGGGHPKVEITLQTVTVSAVNA